MRVYRVLLVVLCVVVSCWWSVSARSPVTTTAWLGSGSRRRLKLTAGRRVPQPPSHNPYAQTHQRERHSPLDRTTPASLHVTPPSLRLLASLPRAPRHALLHRSPRRCSAVHAGPRPSIDVRTPQQRSQTDRAGASGLRIQHPSKSDHTRTHSGQRPAPCRIESRTAPVTHRTWPLMLTPQRGV